MTVDIQAKANADVKLAGIYFLVHLPGSDYSNGSVQPIEATPPFNAPVSLAATRPSERNHYFAGSARGLDVVSRNRQLEMTFDAPRNIVIEDDRRKPDAGLDIYFPLTTGNMAAGQSVHANITFKASGDVDKTPASLTIDPSQRGRPFDGIGGNFRLQTPADPPQIQYNLENLRVAWGRVAMPLNLWQPDENEDPIQAATAGKLDAGVRDAMEMAHAGAKENSHDHQRVGGAELGAGFAGEFAGILSRPYQSPKMGPGLQGYRILSGIPQATVRCRASIIFI